MIGYTGGAAGAAAADRGDARRRLYRYGYRHCRDRARRRRRRHHRRHRRLGLDHLDGAHGQRRRAAALRRQGAWHASTPANFDGGDQRTGYAARIGVNKNVLANPALLVQYDATILAGDQTRPNFILGALTKTPWRRRPIPGIGGAANPLQATVGSLTRSVVEAQGRNAADGQERRFRPADRRQLRWPTRSSRPPASMSIPKCPIFSNCRTPTQPMRGSCRRSRT